MMLTTVLLGVSLSMDCIATLLALHTVDHRKKSYIHYVLPAMFGNAHTFMPIFGYLVGINLKGFVSNYDHWLAFLLLTGMGLKMIQASLSNKKKNMQIEKIINFRSLLFLVLVTSLDAAIIGMTLAFLNQPIIESALTIGLTTLTLSLIADHVGDRLGTLFQNSKQEMFAGVVLIGLGVKILVEHLFL